MANRTSPLDPALQESRKTLYAHVGKNLVMYQDLKAVLNRVLPMLHPLSATETKQSGKRLIKAVHKETLGVLVGIGAKR